nr:methyltransferase [Propionibacterium sp.]
MNPDAVARLMLDEAGDLAGRVLVLDDADAALTHAALAAGCEVRAFCDDVRAAAALPPGTRLDSPADPYVRSADLVLLRLPKSLGALEDHCQTVAGAAASATVPGLRLVAGGRTKHMTPTQNQVLGRYFTQVRPSRGRDKARVLTASGPTGAAPRWPRSRHLPEVGLTVWAHGGVFAGTRLDAGTALLLRALAEGLRDAPGRAADLGCGSGILACWLARRGWAVTASDVSWAAVDSTRRTAAANGLTVAVEQRDGFTGVPPASLDLIVSNPPFHQGAAKDSTPTLAALTTAGAVLAPGGEFWCVFNSHLPYLQVLASAVGPTRIVARDRHYTVTRSVATAR